MRTVIYSETWMMSNNLLERLDMKWEGEVKRMYHAENTCLRPFGEIEQDNLQLHEFLLPPNLNLDGYHNKAKNTGCPFPIWHPGGTPDDTELNTENNAKDWIVHDMKGNDVWKPT